VFNATVSTAKRNSNANDCRPAVVYGFGVVEQFQHPYYSLEEVRTILVYIVSIP
jgi:hypothetical protein